jgi:hypothetical protein
MEIRLDGVQKAIPLYRRIGFREEYWSLRFRGLAEKQCVGSAKLMRDDDFDEISVLDIEYFRAPRIGILRYIQEQFPDLCYVIRVNGDLVGYIMAKDSFDEVKIGPWIVKHGYNDKAAELLWSIMNQRAGRKLWVGVPETNYHCIEILLRNKFESLPSSLRMCLGEGKIRENTKGIYGLGGPDKG